MNPAASTVTIDLQPTGKRLQVSCGTPLRDILFAQGVEFACGGHGRCRSCRIKVLNGAVPVSVEDRRLLTEEQIKSGWRLACRAVANEDLSVEIGHWEATILSDNTAVNFHPLEGFGAAIDLGTTTIVAQLLDLQTGRVVGVQAALNVQARHGADIMSRIDFACNDSASTLTRIIREQIGEMLAQLTSQAADASGKLKRVVIVGNTVMHHLFAGRAVEPLARFPFETKEGEATTFGAGELGWQELPQCRVDFLPCLGSFVGSDILAGILSTRLHESDELSVLLDLGTNGEMVIGNRDRLLCASTAAGPAFEGARISSGMRAVTGAISEVTWDQGTLKCHVLGGGEARGVCGSGLVDAVSVGLEQGIIQPSGRFTNTDAFALSTRVKLVQADVRELQLAKGAISAGMRMLLLRLGATHRDVKTVYLAGAFGNYINRQSAWRIGLIDFSPDQVQPAGNAALLGAKMALFQEDIHWRELRGRIQHMPLSDDPTFQEAFVQEMIFPPDRSGYSSSSRSA